MFPLLLAACMADPVIGLSAELHAENPHVAVARVSVDEDATVHIAYGEEGHLDQETPSVSVVAGEEIRIAVLGLRADRTYTLAAVADDGDRTWTSSRRVVHTPPLPDDWPRCEVDTFAPEGVFGPDEVVCTDFYLDQLDELRFACVDREGQVVLQVAPADHLRIMATTPLRHRRFAAASFSSDRVSVFDEVGGLTEAFSSTWLQGRTRFEHEWIDGHEVIQLDQGPWEGALAFITYTPALWSDEVLLGGGIVVVEPTTGEVLWDWSSHGELGDGVPVDPKLDYQRRGLLQEGASDWQHANALVHGLDEDGGQFMWLSLRRQDWIIKVDVETDEVVWRLGWDGDFTLVEDLDDPDSREVGESQWFYHQHSPELQWHEQGRARFLLFDNGNVRVDQGEISTEPLHSRVVELEIDEEALRAQLVWSYGSSDVDVPEHFYASGMGDANMLPGGDRLQYSTGVYSERSYIEELSYPGGERLWRLTCFPVLGMYRAVFFPSLYERAWWYDVER